MDFGDRTPGEKVWGSILNELFEENGEDENELRVLSFFIF